MSNKEDRMYYRSLWNQKIINALAYAMKHPDLEAIREGNRVLREQRKNIKSVEVHADGISLHIPSLMIDGADHREHEWN